MSRSLAAVGCAAGAVVLIGVIIIFLWFHLSSKRNISRASESNSSDLSIEAGQRSSSLPFSIGVSCPSDSHEARCFRLEELDLATKKFNESNLIGNGKFGEVYKGLLEDGMIVAIKRRPGEPSPNFIHEVSYLSSIHHRNIVRLLGHCQENGFQMLVHEYIPNGSVFCHLDGGERPPKEKLEFKHRLSIALGAAKGMDHLHNLNPPLIHKDFRTESVLVDENFIAKVSDAGLTSLLDKIGASSSSQMKSDDVFMDPELRETRRFTVKSDVYSFGVFLLELVSKREAVRSQFLETNQSVMDWAHNFRAADEISAIIDPRLANSFTAEGMKEFLWLTVKCTNPLSDRRPPMNYVMAELDRILEKEMSLTTVMGEANPIVTLGSQLFTASQ